MAKVTEVCQQAGSRTVFICDFSPPRGSDPELLEPARHIGADFISVAYNPGRSARVNSAMAAHWIKSQAGRDVLFTLATRDMNKVAVQSLLMGADLLGLQNVVVVQGDAFSERELASVKEVSDFKPTELVRSISLMNQGTDFRGLKLRTPTSLCVGATLDMGRGIEREARLTRRKVEAGAEFFLAQPSFSPDQPRDFLSRYAEQSGQELSRPVFFGVQVMAPEGIVFSNVPEWVTDDLARGRNGQDIALHVLHQFVEAGLGYIYLVPPILRGGVRDYEAAQAVLEAFRRERPR